LTILQIGVLAATAALIGRLRGGRPLATLGVSALVIFWLQPEEPEATLRFWLPAATLAITVIAWALTSSREARDWRRNWPAVAVLAAVVLAVEANRYLRFFPSSAVNLPRLEPLLMGTVAVAAIILVTYHCRSASRVFLILSLVGIVLIFILLKTPVLVATANGWLLAVRPGTSEVIAGASLTWLGYSYLAFRLLHTIRDRQSGRLEPVTLAEYVDYVIFFPAFTAGPIDRVERFVKDLRSPIPLTDADWIDAGTRLVVGLFKKFVIADLLAVLSINDVLVAQTRTAGWLWVFLYAYAFRIYFDFSGYTDVAIGMGRLLGVKLPENFASPYLKGNIAQFWNSWHMSLTQWFRAYVFNPLTRALTVTPLRPPDWLIVLIAQVLTMLLIGLWHGIAWGFAAWGLWHGLGLFVHNRWVLFTRGRIPTWTESRRGRIITQLLSVAATFNFVALGWLFFDLSTPSLAFAALMRLFGFSG
jgi:alginate O-acetyltransferase complex protein AlgI